jgi:hypothetical protein
MDLSVDSNGDNASVSILRCTLRIYQHYRYARISTIL